ncbi:hypothetical protein [Prauserella flavalba]|uniref:Uncharacterized protein n=1 Tax=Prauserella flavalba TaxID=1477506 RepID=A0A318LUE6_9PSEU|nr:hypothetical protein [Prauserella flavalba]PXY36027.1 hypothetical protein BA062_11300 [Prauserella flavalba]
MPSPLAGFRALGDRWGTAAALADGAGHLLSLGELDESERAARESAELFGERWVSSPSSAVTPSRPSRGTRPR